VRSRNWDATSECFFIEAVSTFSLDHFHFLETAGPKHKRFFKRLSFAVRGHCAQETYRQANRVMESNVYKCIYQVLVHCSSVSTV
jgi:hypothetical protein